MNRLGRVGTAVVVAVMMAAAVGLTGCDGDNGTGGSGGGSGSGATLADNRDGTQYKTVVIKGKTWMAEDLNYKTDSSWCYGDAAECKYRLYTWNAALTACPSGWGLPSRQEWGDLVVAAGGTGTYGADGGTAAIKLKSKSGWFPINDGKDDFGFSALPTGTRSVDGYFELNRSYGYWWTATNYITDYEKEYETEYGGRTAYYRSMRQNGDDVQEDIGHKSDGNAVRCIKNGGNNNNNGSGNWPFKTVVIDGKMWMAENLNVETLNSWCYNDDTIYCTKYGRLYTWEAAKTACPKEWKLPDTIHWNNLERVAGGYGKSGMTLKSNIGWNDYCGKYDDEPCISGNGTNDLGFSALPGGDRDYDGKYYDAGYIGNWWTSSGSTNGFAERRSMNNWDKSVDVQNRTKREGFGYSVRCVKE